MKNKTGNNKDLFTDFKNSKLTPPTINYQLSTNNQKGTAIILAMGIIIMVFMLGMLFTTKAILGRKSTENYNSLQQARITARSAIHRAIATLNLYGDDDFSSIFDLGDDSQNNYYSYNAEAVSDTVKIEYLSDLLTTTINDTQYFANSVPNIQWQYLPENHGGTEADGSLIPIRARMAYFIEPDPNFGKININACMDSGYNAFIYDKTAITEFDANLGQNGNTGNPAAGTAEITMVDRNGNYVIGRPGRNLNELFLRTMFREKNNYILVDELSCQPKDFIEFMGSELAQPKGYLPKSTTGKPSEWKNLDMLELLFNTQGNSNVRNKWFTDVDREYYENKISFDTRNSPEAFRIVEGSIKPVLYHRFNLTRNDWDSVTVDKILSNPIEYTNSSSESSESIQWLRNWKDKGDMLTGDKNKYQIAANLIDYCDNNSFPTSDYKESENELKLPTYVGIDSCPMANEVEIEVKFRMRTENKLVTKTNGSTVTKYRPSYLNIDSITAKIELINMYDVPFTISEDATVDIKFSFDAEVNLKTLPTIKSDIITLKLTSTSPTTIGGKEYKVLIFTASRDQLVKYRRDTFTSNQSIYNASEGNVLYRNTSNFKYNLKNFISSDLRVNLRGYPSSGSVQAAELIDYAYVVFNKDFTTPDFNRAFNGVSVGDMVDSSGKINNDYAEPKLDDEGNQIKDEQGNLVYKNEIKEDINLDSEYILNSGSDNIFTGIASNGSSVIAEDTGFIFLNFQTDDPRQNMWPNDWSKNFKSVYNTNWKDFPDYKPTLKTDPASTELTGAINNSIYGTLNSEKDLEYKSGITNPWNISTAIIRNAPMKSPWELGLIHRGSAWQTINLKKFNNDDTQGIQKNAGGNEYSKGDANILNQIKMTANSTNHEKISINSDYKDRIDNTDKDYEPVHKLLFEKIRVGSFEDAGNTEMLPGWLTTEEIDSDKAKVLAEALCDLYDKDNPVYFQSRAEVLKGDNKFTQLLTGTIGLGQNNDAMQEEIIGKFINLTEAKNNGSEFTLVVMAQTIDDIDGIKNAKIGTYEPGIDKVTATQKMMAKVYRNPVTGDVKIKSFKYLENK